MSVIGRALGVLRKKEERREEDFSYLLSAGPLSLFCSLVLAMQQRGNLDLLAVCIAGLFLCMKLRMRGFVYALFLLAIGAFCKHLFFLDSHFWQLGVEATVAIGFFMSSLAAEWTHSQEENLRAQMTSKESTVRHLEDDLAKARVFAQEDQIALQEKISALQKDLDDALSESSSLQILNEVLRKTAADAASIADERGELEGRIVALLNEIEEAAREIAHLKDTSGLYAESERLLKELNVARIEKEQTYLINETIGSALANASKRAEHLEEALAERESKISVLECEMAEIVSIKQNDHTSELIVERDQTISLLQERIQALSHIHSLYLQLKQQFDEKNQILHKTRGELFQCETTLEGLRIEQDLQVPNDHYLCTDLAVLDEKLSCIERENRELMELVSYLSSSSEFASKSHLSFDKSGSPTDKDLRKQILQGFLKTSQKALLLREFPDLVKEGLPKTNKKPPKK